MVIQRDRYLDRLKSKRGNGLVKVVTGLRGSGKTFLLFEIYRNWLVGEGIREDHIIGLDLDSLPGARYRGPMELDRYIRSRISDTEMYYVFLDGIRMVSEIRNPYLPDPDAKIGAVDVLLGLMKMKNVDLYVTGDSAGTLSSDIPSAFRGRGDEIRVCPLTYGEFYSAYDKDKRYAWREYSVYGGMPYVMSLDSHEEKSGYLRDLFSRTYLPDILGRSRVLHDRGVLDDLLDILSSSVGSPTDPRRLAAAFQSMGYARISANTVSRYLEYFCDLFLISKVRRYDIKGKRYRGSPLKYYFADVGLRNARLGFRQPEEGQVMENVIFNDLAAKGYDVGAGFVEYSHYDAAGKKVRSRPEAGFVAEKWDRRVYVQPLLTAADGEKRQQAINPLIRIGDSFKKIVVVRDAVIPRQDENGILYMGIEDFLLDPSSPER